MSKPQQPELHRSGKGATDPNSTKTSVEVQPGLAGPGAEAGPVPEDNLPGHHPAHDQDKPDPDGFVARFSGADRPDDDAEATPPGAAGTAAKGSKASNAGATAPAERDRPRPATPPGPTTTTVRAEADLDQPGGLSGLLANAPRPVVAAAGLLFLPWGLNYLIAREIYRRLTQSR